MEPSDNPRIYRILRLSASNFRHLPTILTICNHPHKPYSPPSYPSSPSPSLHQPVCLDNPNRHPGSQPPSHGPASPPSSRRTPSAVSRWVKPECTSLGLSSATAAHSRGQGGRGPLGGRIDEGTMIKAAAAVGDGAGRVTRPDRDATVSRSEATRDGRSVPSPRSAPSHD